MNIGVDIDGVLADQVPAALAAIEANHQMSKPDIQTWDEPIPRAETDIETVLIEPLQDPVFVRSMDTVDGAVAGMQELSQQGYCLHIVTDRPEVARGPTEEWLHQQEIPYDKIRFTNGNSKSSVDVDVLIDDYPKNITKFVSAGGHGLLFSQPWNRSTTMTRENCYRVKDWEEVLSMISSLCAIK